MKKQQIRFCLALALLSVLVFVPVSRALAEKPAGNLTPEQEGVKLTVTIEGPGEAKWLFRGKSFDSGHTLADIPDGKYTVAFTDVPGWDKPADAELSMTKGHAVSIHGKYIRQLGALAVKMEGPAGAKWIFDGKEYESGRVIENLPTGEYKVSFREVPEWTSPGEKTVTVLKNKTAAVDEKYVRHTGSVAVKIDGPKEARWVFEGKQYESGHTVSGVPTGKYVVSFADVPDWTRPGDAQVAVTKDGTASAEGKYVRHTGSVAVKIDGPKEARWVFEGKQYESGHTVSGVPTGKYVVSFADVPDWTRPDDAPVAVTKDGTASAEGKYVRHTGSVAVKIDGPKEARWVFEGKQYESDHTVSGVPTGKYVVSFADVPDWTRPGDAPVAVTKDGTASAEGKYVRHTGSVAVKIDGPKEARWVFEGKQYESGHTVSGVPIGKYVVSFADVPDWTRPGDAPVAVTKDGTASAGGAYIKHTGSLTVSMEGPKEASWSINGKGSYANGQTIGSLDVGPVTVSFSEIAGWTKPENLKVTIKNKEATKASGMYIRHTGSVRVDITGTKDGRWSLDGKGNYPGGWTEKNIPTGSYKIIFSDVTGRIKPEARPVTVTLDKTASVKAEYINNTGSVTVKIDGPGEARWTIDGKGSYTNGQTVGEILPGSRVISFTYVKGWKSPADVKVTVQKDGTATAEGTYQKLQ